ncbi:MAG: acetyl-CoA decarbonylase/synthase complex subunit gamma [Candidatus Omnitrophica bacterium]|nr:acetyl-CoA decarbonylase/synthase complex subunit gamma [Candidatus Omnitrophota bacterium]
MALSGLDIYKLLPKTNCRECGFVTCLAFAMQLVKRQALPEKCPYLSEQAKSALDAASRPPIKLVVIGEGEDKLEIGNETVMFRHEEKFHHPTGLGFIIEDGLSSEEILKTVNKINALSFERIGCLLRPNLIAIKQNGDASVFAAAVKLVKEHTNLGLVLISKDASAQRSALEIAACGKPLIYGLDKNNLEAFTKLAVEFKVPLVVSLQDLSELSAVAGKLIAQGVEDLILDTGNKNIAEKIWDLTQIRRRGLYRSERSLGFPTIVTIEDSADRFDPILEAATYIAKYAGVVLIKANEPWQALSLLTLRQNIYTDPQRPLQVESKLYPIGNTSDKSPVLITTNFSLSYYTVLGEVEASKIPAYIMTIDTEGMSVLTAWAAEKFTPESISAAIDKYGLKEQVCHKQLVIPGYVAVMSGKLEDACGWQVAVGPKEASGIPSFLKNLQL